MGLLLINERDRIRKEFFRPQIERRKNLRFLKRIVAARNHSLAEDVRNSLVDLRR
jgi:hypothetical protein